MIKKHAEQATEHLKRGTEFVSKIFDKTGIPHSYSHTVAWFAERMAIGALVLAVLSFAAGAMFVMRWADPISETRIYGQAEKQALLAQQGVREFSQQVIDIASPMFGTLVEENREEVDPKEAERALLTIRKEKIRVYLETKKSPFAQEDTALQAFAESRNMKLMIAISFVESTFGKKCYYFNCSGIGGTPPNLRKYNNYAEWIRDFDDLLERRYKNLPPEDFIGLYVQPGSANWLYGVKQVLGELEERGIARIEPTDLIKGQQGQVAGETVKE